MRTSTAGKPRFSDDDITRLQLLDRKGWTYDTWDNLSDNEQLDWLAFERWRRKQLDDLFKHIRDIESFDVLAAQVLILLNKLG